MYSYVCVYECLCSFCMNGRAWRNVIIPKCGRYTQNSILSASSSQKIYFSKHTTTFIEVMKSPCFQTIHACHYKYREPLPSLARFTLRIYLYRTWILIAFTADNNFLSCKNRLKARLSSVASLPATNPDLRHTLYLSALTIHLNLKGVLVELTSIRAKAFHLAPPLTK